MISSQVLPEKVILVAVQQPGQETSQVQEYLDELTFLAETAGAQTLRVFIQKLSHPDPRTYVGKGKLTEIIDYVKVSGVEIAIFDDELSPSQIRNIEKVIGVLKWKEILFLAGLVLIA